MSEFDSEIELFAKKFTDSFYKDYLSHITSREIMEILFDLALRKGAEIALHHNKLNILKEGL